MATVVLGSVVADIRGSIGSETYSRNLGGICVRNRTSPAQPASTERDLRQAAMTAISQAWSATLTESQRSTWRRYAKQHPLPDRWGRPKTSSGLCHFVRSNIQRYRTAAAITVTSAPAAPPPPMPAISCTLQAEGDILVGAGGTPDISGTYSPWIPHEGKPSWRRTDGAYFAWYYPTLDRTYLSDTLGVFNPPYWNARPGPTGTYFATPPAVGNVASAWAAGSSLITLPVPPSNYPDPAPNMRLFAFAGQAVTLGRSYYRTPFRYVGANASTGGVWTLDPWIVPHWAVLTVPGRVFVRVVAVLADGATSVAGYAQADIQT